MRVQPAVRDIRGISSGNRSVAATHRTEAKMDTNKKAHWGTLGSIYRYATKNGPHYRFTLESWLTRNQPFAPAGATPVLAA
jgi:hypothetical protein